MCYLYGCLLSLLLSVCTGLAQPDSQSGRLESELPTNLCVVNRLRDTSSEIVGIYVVPASRLPLRGNKQIEWSENFLAEPLRSKAAAVLAVDCTNSAWFDIRIDIQTGSRIVQYFHRSAHFPMRGQILHKAIVSEQDQTAEWKISERVDKNFGG
jgi:hypothetical protein